MVITHPAHSPEFIAQVTDSANWLPLPVAEEFRAAAVVALLSGQDSVSASGMLPGHDVYGGYGGFSSFSNMSSVKAHFPGKKYIVFDTHVSQVDCYDIEPGGGSASQAASYFHQWKKVNLDKPAFYASASQMASVRAALNAAGIPRASYYLIVAQWDGSPIIPSGYDGKQYFSTGGYDSDSFESYMWTSTPPVPVPAWPLKQGSTDSVKVKTLQDNLWKWAKVIGLKAPAGVHPSDGNFGPLTAAAVTLAQVHFGEHGHPAGECSQAIFNALSMNPGPTPPPPASVLKPVTGLKVLAVGPHSVKFQFTAAEQQTGLARFEVVVCQGTKLGQILPGYPRYIEFLATGVYTQQYGGVDGTKQSVLAVRAQEADGTRSSKWAEVSFPKASGPVVTPPASGYANPLRNIVGLIPQRIDQGVDYAGSGPLYSIGNGTVLNTHNSGWPGGAFISVRLSDGPAAGKIFYYAENITPHVTVGQKVTKDTVLGTLINAFPNCELGWAAEPGTGEALARQAGQTTSPANSNTAYGKNFSDLLVSLGAPAGVLNGPVVGHVAAGWPAW